MAAGDGSSVDEPDCEGRTPLVRAVLEGRKMQARALVEDGHANVNFYYTEDKAVRTTLYLVQSNPLKWKRSGETVWYHNFIRKVGNRG